jgi:hypothetical protein
MEKKLVNIGHHHKIQIHGIQVTPKHLTLMYWASAEKLNGNI